MTRWEYLTEMPKARGASLSETRLNELGGQGWELAAVVIQSEHSIAHWIFKRQVTS